MTRRLVAPAFALVAVPALAQTPTLTCEMRGDIRHCFDHHGYESTEQRSPGGYVHGWDNRGGAWTTWDHNGLADPVLTGPWRGSGVRSGGMVSVPSWGMRGILASASCGATLLRASFCREDGRSGSGRGGIPGRPPRPFLSLNEPRWRPWRPFSAASGRPTSPAARPAACQASAKQNRTKLAAMHGPGEGYSDLIVGLAAT
jgi:hypothetical protein